MQAGMNSRHRRRFSASPDVQLRRLGQHGRPDLGMGPGERRQRCVGFDRGELAAQIRQIAFCFGQVPLGPPHRLGLLLVSFGVTADRHRPGRGQFLLGRDDLLFQLRQPGPAVVVIDQLIHQAVQPRQLVDARALRMPRDREKFLYP